MPPKPHRVAITHRHICYLAKCQYLDKINYEDPCLVCPEGHFGPWISTGCQDDFVPLPVSESSNFFIPVYYDRGPGTELKKLLSKLGFRPAQNCKCNQHIQEMNMRGIEWCSENIPVITEWLREEAQRAQLPFFAPGAKIIIRKAISNAKKLP
jgi:hypothetical protein